GDIVLQAESTQFRVNRDVLATQSSVFADMFSVPQPPNEPTVDGCPVVILSGDSAEDWELLIQILYEPFDDKEMRPFEEIAAMLRLGRKYGFSAAEANAVRRIHWEFLITLAAWDKSSASFIRVDFYEGLVADILNLAHEFGLNSSIPAIAFCCLDMYSLDRILTGMKRPDSSRIVLHPDVEKMLAVGLARIMGFQYTSWSWVDNEEVVPTSSCTNRARCELGIKRLRRWCMSNARFDGPACFMLSTWPANSFSGRFCGYCDDTAQNAFNARRVKGWEALPSFFGLAKWDELKDVE
ncbi:hypothetical protein FB45DRAFT_743239, partial [Roridomyces roridus]